MEEFDESDANVDNMELDIRPMHKSKTTPDKRIFCLTPNEKLRVKELEELQKSIEKLLELNPSDADYLQSMRANIGNELDRLLNRNNSLFNIQQISCRINNMISVESACSYLGNSFASHVGFQPKEIYIVSNLLFENYANEIRFKNQNQKSLGTFNAVEVTFLVCMRMRGHYASWSALSKVFGRDPGLLCKIWNISLNMILAKHGWTISLKYLDRFAGSISDYQQAIQQLFNIKSSTIWSNLNPRIQKIALLLDGVRIPIPRPKNDGITMYTGYKSQYNINIISIWSPDGACLAVAPPAPGFFNDSAIINEYHVNAALRIFLDAAAVADGIFASDSHIIALREGLDCTFEEKNALKSIRGSVEHGFCMLKKQFPLLDCKDKLKIGANHPIHVILVAFILNNVKTCIRGNQISIRFGLKSPNLNDFFL